VASPPGVAGFSLLAVFTWSQGPNRAFPKSPSPAVAAGLAGPAALLRAVKAVRCLEGRDRAVAPARS
jgi:hypothetical protein